MSDGLDDAIRAARQQAADESERERLRAVESRRRRELKAAEAARLSKAVAGFVSRMRGAGIPAATVQITLSVERARSLFGKERYRVDRKPVSAWRYADEYEEHRISYNPGRSYSNYVTVAGELVVDGTCYTAAEYVERRWPDHSGMVWVDDHLRRGVDELIGELGKALYDAGAA